MGQDAVAPGAVQQKSSFNSGDWPGGRLIVKQSIVDFFTNIVPTLVGMLAIAPLVLALVIQLLTNHQPGSANVAINIISALLGLAGVIAIIFTSLCWISSTPLFGLARADGKKMTTKEVYTVRGSLAWRQIKVGIVLGLGLLAGYLLFIIPGIILTIWLIPAMSLVSYVVVEEDLGTIDSIKRAHQLAKGHAGKVWGIIGWYLIVMAVILAPIVIILAIIFANSSSSIGSTDTSSGGTGSNSQSSGSVGGNLFSAISYAYLYRWIKRQPDATAPVTAPVQAQAAPAVPAPTEPTTPPAGGPIASN